MSRSESSPIQRLAPGVVLLTGPGVDVTRYAVLTAIRARSRNGLPESGALAALLAACTEPKSAQGHSDHPEPADSEGEYVTTKEAAEMLHCTPRHAQRFAAALGGRRIAGRWLIDRQALNEHIEGSAA